VSQRFKIRIYLLTCQNLSAVDSYMEVKAKLAGYKALCSADPFPVLSVGDGKNDIQDQKSKSASDRDKEVNQDLNPKFHRSYEFDATFPEDWKLTVSIYDKGSISFTDGLIGTTTVDLENRLFGNLRKQTLDSLAIYKELTAKEIQILTD